MSELEALLAVAEGGTRNPGREDVELRLAKAERDDGDDRACDERPLVSRMVSVAPNHAGTRKDRISPIGADGYRTARDPKEST